MPDGSKQRGGPRVAGGSRFAHPCPGQMSFFKRRGEKLWIVFSEPLCVITAVIDIGACGRSALIGREHGQQIVPRVIQSVSLPAHMSNYRSNGRRKQINQDCAQTLVGAAQRPPVGTPGRDALTPTGSLMTRFYRSNQPPWRCVNVRRLNDRTANNK